MVYDCIVVGVGGMGSAVCAHLAQRGKRVLGLEQFTPGHALGSSHGESRIIRTAYYEHPDYVPLVRRAFVLWDQLEKETGESLLLPSPCLSIGRHDSELIEGVQQAAKQHQLAITHLKADEIKAKYPIFDFPSTFEGIIEQQAGILRVEKCVLAHQKIAEKFGAELHFQEKVINYLPEKNSITVQTDRMNYETEKIIFCGGAWSKQFLQLSGNNPFPLRLMRQVMFWFDLASVPDFRIGNFPVFIAAVPEGEFYGMPWFDEMGVKMARHYGASEVDRVEQIERDVSMGEEQWMMDQLGKWMPRAKAPLKKSQTCIYTLTPDRHFLIDHLPQDDRIWFATGFSGHGFKFASVVGELMADLAIHGETKLGIERFLYKRFLSEAREK